MAEYIEREKVLSKAAPVEGCFSDMISTYDVAMLPAADVAPVRHGMWKSYTKNLGECSNCGYVVSIRYDYCPNCGAKMDG